MVKYLANIFVRKRLYFFALSILIVFMSSLGLRDAKYSADYRVFFSPSDPHLLAFEDLQNRYTRADNIVFVVAPRNGEVFTHENLLPIEWLTKASWRLPHSLRVDSVTNFPYSIANGDDIVVKDLIEKSDELTEVEINIAKQHALGDPRIVKRLLSEDGRVSAIYVSLNLPRDATSALHELIPMAEELVQQFKVRYPQMDIYMMGLAPFNHSLEKVANQDFQLLGPVMLVLILGIIGWMTRSFRNSIVTLIVIIASVFVTAAIVTLYGTAFNNINTVAPLVIVTLAIADSVHLLSAFSKKTSSGISNVDAMTQSIEENIKPMFLTCFTTAAGMLGMNTIESPPFREFGNITAIGITLAFWFSLTLLPQLAVWFGRASRQKAYNENTGVYLATANFVIVHYRRVFYITFGFALVASTLSYLNDLNDDNIGYFKKNIPVRQAVEFANEHLTGVNTIEYSLSTGRDYGITDITFLKKVEAFAEWYRAQPEVKHVWTFNDTLKSLNKNMHDDQEEWYVLPDTAELASQYILLYELSLPVGMDLSNQIDINKSSMRLIVNMEVMKAKHNLALEQRAQKWLEKNAPELRTPGASPTIMFSHIGQRNINSIMSGTFGAALVICVLLYLSSKSIQLSLLAVVANVLPSAVMLGLWGVFIGEINMGAAVVFTISTGIVVDDTVHFLTRYSDAQRKGYSVDDSIRYTLTYIGHPALTTSLVLISGFGIFMFSNFMVNVTLGIMVAGTIAIALIYDLFFLPSVIKMLDGWFVRYASTTREKNCDTSSRSPLLKINT